MFDDRTLFGISLVDSDIAVKFPAVRADGVVEALDYLGNLDCLKAAPVFPSFLTYLSLPNLESE